MTQFERARFLVDEIRALALRHEGDELAMLLALAWVAGQMEASFTPDQMAAIQTFKSLAAETSGRRTM